LRFPAPLAKDGGMKILILGSGVIGVARLYLARAGHDVTVIDRRRGRPRDQFRQRRGDLAGLCLAMGRAGNSGQAIKWLLMQDGPWSCAPSSTPDVDLGRPASRQLHKRAYAVNKGRMVRLAEYSRDCLIALRRETAIAYDERMQGTLQLFATKSSSTGAGRYRRAQAVWVPYELLDPARCVAAEPGLATSRVEFVGGLRLPMTRPGTARSSPTSLQRSASNWG
jgi:D-amino-acid dehydrogenase